ncbi:uncharacterized protein LOC143023859 [Oratosquilla oratoria]|uniref:uncharacterized protein LOC143023859 n=1 Tax=Oratosquilla oratoria TaxID=337810 RepID=UPI003F776221
MQPIILLPILVHLSLSTPILIPGAIVNNHGTTACVEDSIMLHAQPGPSRQNHDHSYSRLPPSYPSSSPSSPEISLDGTITCSGRLVRRPTRYSNSALATPYPPCSSLPKAGGWGVVAVLHPTPTASETTISHADRDKDDDVTNASGSACTHQGSQLAHSQRKSGQLENSSETGT